MRHTWDIVALDGGVHHCLVCKATNTSLAKLCPGYVVSPEDRAAQDRENLLRYGPGRWVIRDERPDVTVETLVSVGTVLAP